MFASVRRTLANTSSPFFKRIPDYTLCIGWALIRATVGPRRVIITYVFGSTSRLDYQLGFGLGFGLLLLALSFLSGATQRWLTHQFAQRARLINVVGGTPLVGVGTYDLWSNLELIQAFLG